MSGKPIAAIAGRSDWALGSRLGYIQRMSSRDFSMSGHIPSPERCIDDDAPNCMRVELVDSIFNLADENGETAPTERRLYDVTTLACGVESAVQPYGGLRRRASRHLKDVEWPRVYDIVLRLVPEFTRYERLEEYCEAVNRILSANGVVWELDASGRMVRANSPAVQSQVRAAIDTLNREELGAARELFKAARDCYDSRPRRGRDCCANAYDALEAVARVTVGGSTFGRALDELGRRAVRNQGTVQILRALEVMRHNTFGHGTPDTFTLHSSEVDLVFLVCVGGILVFADL